MSLLEDTAWDPKYRAVMGSVGLIVVGFSIALWGGCSDLKATLYSEAEPQIITAHQLASAGPGDNLHVVVTDYSTSREGVGNENVSWFLMNPKPAGGGMATLVVEADGGNALFGVFLPDDGVQGMVRNGSGAFNADQRNAIKKLGPVDFDNLWIIEQGEEPPPWWKFLLKVGGGLALVAVGAAIFLFLGRGD